MSNIYYVNANDFGNENGHLVNNIGGICLVMFHSARCPHCVTFVPEFKRLPGTIMGINFGLCCVDDTNRAIVEMSRQSSTPINAVPKFILYVDGRPFVEYSGQRSRQNVIAFLQEMSVKLNQSQQFARPRRSRQQMPMQQQPAMMQQPTAMAPPPQHYAPNNQPMQMRPSVGGGMPPSQAAAAPSYKIAPNTGVKEYESSYGRPYNTTNEADFLDYERAYREGQNAK